MRDTFVQTLLSEAKKNPDIVLITGDLGYGVLEIYENELPSQFINAGVAEQSMVGLAAGMASTGKRVFVYSIGNFPTIRALEQVRNDVCYMNNAVVIVSVGSGYSYGSQGYTHHALEDIAVMRALPNMEICSPADSFETEILTRRLAERRNPAYLRLGRTGEKKVNHRKPILKDGMFNKIYDGQDGSIIFTGSIGSIVIDAREFLLSRGVEVSVFSAPFVNGLNAQALEQLDPNQPIVVVEEHSLRGGLASSIMELSAICQKHLLITPVYAKSLNSSLIGDQSYLREKNGLGVLDITIHFLGM